MRATFSAANAMPSLLVVAAIVLTTATRLPSAESPALTVDAVSDLLALDAARDGALFAARGYHRPNDDGGGLFRYDAVSQAAADGGAVLQPDKLPGRWRDDPVGAARCSRAL